MHLQADFTVQYAPGHRITPALTAPLANAAVTVLLGPSGCGKTTTLRGIAGLLTPSRGQIRVGDVTWFDSQTRTNLAVQSRRIGMVFQDFALFPHLSVSANIAYGIRGEDRKERSSRVSALLDMCALAHLAHRMPRDISGGEQQRVALARAVATRPHLLLMDEPLASLDDHTRRKVREHLRAVLQTLRIPALLVTHDLNEALGIADHLAVMGAGEAGTVVMQQGTVDELLACPAHSAVALTLGIENLLKGTVAACDGATMVVKLGTVLFLVQTAQNRYRVNDDVVLAFRARDVDIVTDNSQSKEPHRPVQLAATITNIAPDASGVRVMLDAGIPIMALLDRASASQPQISVGNRVVARIRESGVMALGSQ